VALNINTNISAMLAIQNLDNTGTQMQTSIERLSTGLQINSGADNPAGLIITQGMQAELNGIAQAVQNTQDANNMAKTADGALSEVGNLLLTLRGLAVDAANSGVQSSASVQADQTQVQSILQSINGIATNTEFDGKKLLDGSSGALANVTDGTDVAGINMTGTFDNNTLESGPITATKVAAATEAIITLANSFANANAIVTTPGDITVNGYTITNDGTLSVQTIVSKLNAESAQTGVSASINGTGPVNIVLNANNYGSNNNISYFDSSKVLNNKPSATSNGTDAVFDVAATTSSGIQTTLFTGGIGATSGLTLTDANGNTLLLTESGNANITTVPMPIGQVTAGSVQFQIGPDSGQTVNFALPDVFTQNLGAGAVPGKSLSNIDLTTTQGANNAMVIVQAAIQQIATIRGQIGSFQTNILQAQQSYLQTASENLSASQSDIQDTNMASEMTNFTRLQILQQSGVAVLAQANQTPKSVLTLLQSG
jgi:flagellin